jgi:transcriptional regulator, ArsR family
LIQKTWDAEMGDVFKALGDPTRREILRLLKERDMTAGEIAAHFAISKPALTKHLSILREAGLVSSERKGSFMLYSINLTVLQESLSGFLALLEGKKP